SYRVTRELGSGGQGTAFEVADVATGRPYVAKVYHAPYATPEAAARLAALISCDLSTISPALCAPVSRLRSRHGLGAVQPKAEGVPLEKVFENPSYGLLDGIAVAAAIAKAVDVLEARGIAHADISATNVMVRRTDGVYSITLIDLDNASMPGSPGPAFLGQLGYAAPELLLGAVQASLESDRFALAVLTHEILLRRHPWMLAGELSFDDYRLLLSKATWLEDPMDGRHVAPPDGWPVGILSRRLHALFRAALRADPSRRPTAGEWAAALEDALSAVYECSDLNCRQQQVNEPTRFACVACGKAAEMLGLRIAGRTIRFERMHQTVGRADLGGDPTVSRQHAVFTRNGFGLRVRNLSPNGLKVVSNGKTTRLAESGESEVYEGDEITFAPGLTGRIEGS
ncbi:MAG: protein kinase, partial [Spirochaetaceae bacterium]|nr:protein kinase [Spirochaetaceae bacterium]